MIWRWLIFSKLALPLAALAATVSGHIELTNSSDAGVRRHNYAGVVVSLAPVGQVHADAPAHHARMLQKDKMFLPHVLAVQAGTVVDFPNADPIFHNAFSSYSGQIFDVGLYPPGDSRSVRFARPGVVRVFCNIHQSMSALIVVVNSPYFAVTDARGLFSINAPAGDYELRIYHERATDQTLRALARPLQVTESGAELPPIKVSEAGYLPSAHKNKHGQDYPPASNDRAVYPGVRN